MMQAARRIRARAAAAPPPPPPPVCRLCVVAPCGHAPCVAARVSPACRRSRIGHFSQVELRLGPSDRSCTLRYIVASLFFNDSSTPATAKTAVTSAVRCR
jgi:hypothetical protein